MLGKQDRDRKILIEPVQRCEKIRCGNRIQLCGRFIEQEQARLHDHDTCKIEQLLLPAGQLRRIAVKQRFDPEIRGDLGNAAAHDIGIRAEIFQSERQLMPDAVGDDLLLRMLHDEADLSGRNARIQ